MKPITISVITVVYNGAGTLEATLQSVTGQTWPNIEYVIVDGGSTDGTLELIERYRDDIDVFVSERDKGVYDAMNKGINMASGDYIYFLGSDDRLHNSEVLTTIFSDPAVADCDLIYGNVTSPSYKGWYDGPFTYEKLLSRNISHQAIFYRREVFKHTGGYNLRYRMHADWDLNIRWFGDGGIKKLYMPILVGEFGAEGISAGHDVSFLRESLIPQKLQWLKQHPKSLRSVHAFDEWWRYLRNAQIINEQQASTNSGGEPLPPAIRRMIRWQRLIPQKLLRFGPFSKTIMAACFLVCRSTGSL